MSMNQSITPFAQKVVYRLPIKNNECEMPELVSKVGQIAQDVEEMKCLARQGVSYFSQVLSKDRQSVGQLSSFVQNLSDLSQEHQKMIGCLAERVGSLKSKQRMVHSDNERLHLKVNDLIEENHAKDARIKQLEAKVEKMDRDANRTHNRQMNLEEGLNEVKARSRGHRQRCRDKIRQGLHHAHEVQRNLYRHVRTKIDH